MVSLAHGYKQKAMEMWGFFRILEKRKRILHLTGITAPINSSCCSLYVTKVHISIEEKEKQRTVCFFITLSNSIICAFHFCKCIFRTPQKLMSILQL